MASGSQDWQLNKAIINSISAGTLDKVTNVGQALTSKRTIHLPRFAFKTHSIIVSAGETKGIVNNLSFKGHVSKVYLFVSGTGLNIDTSKSRIDILCDGSYILSKWISTLFHNGNYPTSINKPFKLIQYDTTNYIFEFDINEVFTFDTTFLFSALFRCDAAGTLTIRSFTEFFPEGSYSCSFQEYSSASLWSEGTEEISGDQGTIGLS